jgi:hypothetical protein
VGAGLDCRLAGAELEPGEFPRPHVQDGLPGDLAAPDVHGAGDGIDAHRGGCAAGLSASLGARAGRANGEVGLLGVVTKRVAVGVKALSAVTLLRAGDDPRRVRVDHQLCKLPRPHVQDSPRSDLAAPKIHGAGDLVDAHRGGCAAGLSASLGARAGRADGEVGLLGVVTKRVAVGVKALSAVTLLRAGDDPRRVRVDHQLCKRLGHHVQDGLPSSLGAGDLADDGVVAGFGGHAAGRGAVLGARARLVHGELGLGSEVAVTLVAVPVDSLDSVNLPDTSLDSRLAGLQLDASQRPGLHQQLRRPTEFESPQGEGVGGKDPDDGMRPALGRRTADLAPSLAALAVPVHRKAGPAGDVDGPLVGTHVAPHRGGVALAFPGSHDRLRRLGRLDLQVDPCPGRALRRLIGSEVRLRRLDRLHGALA